MRPLRESEFKGEGCLRLPPKDMVTISATFTKVGYAQIISQQYDAPAIWHEAIQSARGELAKAAETGTKLSCAYEMLLADPQYTEKDSVKTINHLIDLVRTQRKALPTQAEIDTWEHSEDDENWLDVNFSDFEKDLAGSADRSKPDRGKGAPTFTDEATQENLHKMVQRFEEFLNDKSAGPDGAEILEDMDYDDEDDSDISSSGEDKDISFDEEEFSRMMREMMGMPRAAPADTTGRAKREGRDPSESENALERIQRDNDDDDAADEAALLRKEMQAIEAELSAAGALTLEPPGQDATHGPRRIQNVDDSTADADDSEDDDGEINVDLQLAKNLLESFKSQGGAAGPGGNLLGLLGMKLPRDEQDDDDEDGKGGSKSLSQ
jgi:hypothetical protein